MGILCFVLLLRYQLLNKKKCLRFCRTVRTLSHRPDLFSLMQGVFIFIQALIPGKQTRLQMSGNNLRARKGFYKSRTAWSKFDMNHGKLTVEDLPTCPRPLRKYPEYHEQSTKVRTNWIRRCQYWYGIKYRDKLLNLRSKWFARPALLLAIPSFPKRLNWGAW